MSIFEIEIPASDLSSRMFWAGERFHDINEEIIDRDKGWAIWAIIVGWADLGTDAEKTSYRTIAKMISELLRSKYGE